MLSTTLILGLSAFANAAPSYKRNTTTSTPRHYLSESITNQTFFNGSCTAETVSIRKEWRSLTDIEKKAFVDAELCLMALPNQTSLPGATTRFDDFQAAHQQGTNTTYGDVIHYTVSFLKLSTWTLLINSAGNVPSLAPMANACS
jgi:hypothetical protein